MKLQFNLTILLTIFLLAACSQPEQDEITVFMIGDSTMANKRDPGNNPERGWGMLFHKVFNDKVTISNHAVNGRSSKSFMDEGRWDSVLNMIKPGDYVIIQFGHNDQKFKAPSRYTNPYSSYYHNLEKYVTDTRDKLASPIICSSIVRRNFNEQGTLVDTHGAYPFIARMVAKDLDVPFLDLQYKTEMWIAAEGPDESKKYFMNLEPGKYELFPDGRTDNTHLVEKGAYTVSVFAAEELVAKNVPLASYLKPGLFDE